jgi:hypothetical protein
VRIISGSLQGLSSTLAVHSSIIKFLNLISELKFTTKGAVDGLNLYIYVGNNPLKYIDPTGHFPLISWDRFVSSVNAYKANLVLYPCSDSVFAVLGSCLCQR